MEWGLAGRVAVVTGSIVNICSVNSILADPAVIDYCAAKAALANFSKALSGPRARSCRASEAAHRSRMRAAPPRAGTSG